MILDTTDKAVTTWALGQLYVGGFNNATMRYYIYNFSKDPHIVRYCLQSMIPASLKQ